MIDEVSLQSEESRLAAIQRYDILDSPREPTFDRIVAIIQAVFETEWAMITFVDRERSWYKSEVGLGLREMPRPANMCDAVIRQDGVLVISDAQAEPPEKVMPMLEFGLRFYAGAPLCTDDGIKIGTVCAVDPRPMQVSGKQTQILADLAKIVVDELELRLAARKMLQADEALRSLNQQLEVANRNKSEFLASMSHELRTPLNGILGASELLSQGLFGGLNAKQQEYLGDIQHSGAHLLRLIDDLLDLSRIEAGQFELHLEALDVGMFMEACCAVVRGLTSAKFLHVELSPPREKLLIRADQRRMTQVACNLLSNALKFSPEHGKVLFRAWLEAGEVRFLVEDEGAGIEPQYQERIFEQFFRIASDQEGTGLGLALAKQLLELHGGRIWLDSRPDRGSRFFFALPLQPDD